MGYQHEIRVAWGDCDPAKIVYTGRIPAYALDAIEGWWDHFVGQGGWYHTEFDRRFGVPFVHMELDFRSPITPRHRLICDVAPLRLGNSSLEFRVIGSQDGKVCFEGRFVSVFVDQNFEKSSPPDDVRQIILDQIPAAG